jgi:hypothetical protein
MTEVSRAARRRGASALTRINISDLDISLDMGSGKLKGGDRNGNRDLRRRRERMLAQLAPGELREMAHPVKEEQAPTVPADKACVCADALPGIDREWLDELEKWLHIDLLLPS